MYLTKYTINRQNPSARQALINAQDMHRNVMALFNTSRSVSKVLYRLDSKSTSPRLYILSATEPGEDTTHGMKKEGCADISEFVKTFSEGTVLSFDVLAVPSKKVYGKENTNSKRVLLSSNEMRQEWWQRKAKENGFELLDIVELERVSYPFCHGRKWVTLEGYHYQGKLTINDKQKFLEAYINGIGAEKAYGFGMMVIKR